MAPQSRGPPSPMGMQSKSTPDLPTLRRLSMTSEPVSPLSTENTAPDAEPYSGSSSDNEKPSIDQHSTLRHQLAQQTRFSHSHLTPNASHLFPPFYNRPKTPLPPSPSLTSLLRPSFSTHTSRQTTPESSDVESTIAGGNSSTALAEKSAQAASAVPRASPKVPTYEYYGFALYLASSVAFLMYILWAYLPSPFLHQLGIYYYPNRWWALAIPAWLVVLVMYIYVALASYNTGSLTLGMANIENLVDEAAQIAVVDKDGKIIGPKKQSRFRTSGKSNKHHARRHSSGKGAIGGPYVLLGNREVRWAEIWDEGTDAVLDIPIGGVCEILYGSEREASPT
jgi:phosphatidylinositol glycan class P protein